MNRLPEQADPAGRIARLAGAVPDTARTLRCGIVGPLSELTPTGPLASRRTITREAAGVLLSQSDVPGDFYDISLVYRDPRPPQVLYSGEDDRAVVALWRSTATELGLPLMVKRQDGAVVQPYEHCGAVLVGPFRYRRRTAALRSRRPRFLQRRKTTCLPDRPIVRREREMTPKG